MAPQTQRQPSVTVRVFNQRFSSTRRGARLARLLALHQLDSWLIPYRSSLSESVGLIVAELATNAATHGCVPGRDFELGLLLTMGSLRVEVSDTRGDRVPPGPDLLAPPCPLADAGRGLCLVDALATRWGIASRTPAPGKTVWAELAVGPPGGHVAGRPLG
ncbi:ATP-binding protein [Streptomyces sp. N2-109]|uniref:ATP-binding protein n=1 Tax=Streptomyces gossypii TaxID=2883101 RepID=A0ABT2JQF0_9ACTN|nr:ATP-binding protein [Streptomyces gossypii]MCT2590041.1 ATP-binding protein [Streptomyces gossypii]